MKKQVLSRTAPITHRRISGVRLEQARQRAGFSREQSAVEVGRSYHSIKSYELGCNQPPVSVLLALVDLYGITVDELVEEVA
jgi:predicted transcriptional regulator